MVNASTAFVLRFGNWRRAVLYSLTKTGNVRSIANKLKRPSPIGDVRPGAVDLLNSGSKLTGEIIVQGNPPGVKDLFNPFNKGLDLLQESGNRLPEAFGEVRYFLPGSAGDELSH
jgi:hypothetical protein